MKLSLFALCLAVCLVFACGQSIPKPPTLGVGQTFDPNVVTAAQGIQYGPGPYYCGQSRYVCPQWQYATCLQNYCVYTTCGGGGANMCPSDRSMCDTSVNYCKDVSNNTTIPPSPDAGPPRACRKVTDCNSGEFCRVTTSGCTTATGTCVVSRDLICLDDYLTYCSCSGATVYSWYSTDCAPEQYQYAGACQFADGGLTVPDGGVRVDAGVSSPDAGTTPSDAGLPDAGVSTPDAGLADGGVRLDGGVTQPDAGVTVPDAGLPDAGVSPPADGGAPAPTVPSDANGVVRMVMDASRVLCANPHLAAFSNTANWAAPVENGTLALDIVIKSGLVIMDTTIHCGSHVGSPSANDYDQYGANGQTAAAVGYKEIWFYFSNGSRIDLLTKSVTCNRKVKVPVFDLSTPATCP